LIFQISLKFFPNSFQIILKEPALLFSVTPAKLIKIGEEGTVFDERVLARIKAGNTALNV
jgi:hypothetical protein